MGKDIFGLPNSFEKSVVRQAYNPFGVSKKENKRQPVSLSQKNEVLARQNNRCARCHKPLDMRAKHLDHKKEVYKGGKSKINNLQYLCANCHNIKTHEDKLRKVEKRRNSKPSQNNVYGLPNNKNLFKNQGGLFG